MQHDLLEMKNEQKIRGTLEDPGPGSKADIYISKLMGFRPIDDE